MKSYLLLFCLFFVFISSSYAQVKIYGANNIPNETEYNTLKAAFDAINAIANQSGKNIEVRISASVTETATANLTGMNWKSFTIFPTVDNLTINANMGSAVIRLDGTHNVTLDGRVNKSGSTASLTVINTSANGGAVAIDLLNSAQNNTLQYTKFKGQLADNSRGVVFIGSSSSGEGNNNNIIQYNEISGISETERPRHAIASNGTAGRENKNNKILNNKIFNFLNKSASTNGITLISGSDNFTISGNSFYETVEDFAPMGGYIYYAIRTNTNSVHTISNNFIGGNAPENTGIWKTKKGVADAHHRFTAIYVAGKEDEASLVQGNIIMNFNMVTGGSASNHDTWNGIFIQDGNVDVSNNSIGATTGTGSIYVEATHGGTFATAHGILNNSTGTVNIKYNTIGSIEIKGSVNYSHSFESIYLRTRANITFISGNLIGSLTTANSIHVSGTANSSGYKQDNYAIYSASQNEVHILGNTVANLHNAYSGTIGSSRTRGIMVLAGSNNIVRNEIFNISSASNQGVEINSSASVIGIDVTANVGATTQNIIGNTIYDLNADNGGETAVSAFGIYFSGPTNAERNTIERNFIHSLRSSSTSNNSLLIGLLFHRGNNTVFNNVISLGVNISRGYRIYGVWDDSGSSNHNNLYFNTIYLGGNVTAGSGTSVSTALWNQNNSSTRDYRNNIFANQRLLNGSGSDNLYAVRIGGSTNLTMDYNNYWSVANKLGRNGTKPLRPNLSSWRAESQGDQNSYEVDPLFVNISETWTSSKDFITNISIGDLPGIVISGINDDYDGVGRLDPTKIGAFENNNFTWYGTVSTDFNNPDNWSNGGGNGIVPPNGADVQFASTPYRNCYLDKDRAVRNIIINSTNTNNNFFLNGKTLNLRGALDFSNNAKLNTKQAGSMLVLQGFDAQTLPAGSITDNEFAGLSLDNKFGFTQNENFTLTESFVLTDGTYSIADNTLTISGSISQTGGTLTGSSTSNIIFGGSGAATILPGVELNNLVINRANGINMAGDVGVAGTLALSSGTLSLGANKLTISGNSPTGTGSIDASNSAAVLIFDNNDGITLLSTFFGNHNINDLTISGSGGVTSRGDFTLNGILNLHATNPDAIKGSLDMLDGTDLKTLFMGANAITKGQGDVNGKVKRTTIEANTTYTFGSQYTTIAFTGGTGTQLPSDLTFIIQIGKIPPNAIKDDAEKRYYEIIRTGGSSPTRFNLNLRYLYSELNGNEQTKMVFWDHHVPYNGISPHEHGVSFHNTIDSYMALAEHGIGYLVQGEYTGEIAYVNEETTPQNQSKIWLLSNRITPSGNDVFIWIGPYVNNSDWTSDNNWADNCSPANAAAGLCPDAPYNGATIPPSTHKIFIQSGASHCIAPDADLRAYSIYVEEDGEFEARAGRKIEVDYINVFAGGSFTAINNTIDVLGAININNGNVSWNNTGSFEAGTSKVYFKNANAALSGSSAFFDVEIPALYKLSMMDASRMVIENTFTVSGTFNTTFHGSTIVEYNGGVQTVINPENNEYSTLILSGNGNKTLPAGLTKVLRDFEISGATSTTGTAGLTIDGNMSIATSASFSTGAYDHSLNGNFENDGTFTVSSGKTFSFVGNTNQLISGNAKSSFDILERNNSNNLNLFSDVDVNNELKLTSGILYVGENTLGINGTISGASASNKIHVSNLSSLSFGGTGFYSIPNDVFVNSPTIDNLTIDRSGGVYIANQDFTINGNLALLEGNLVVGSSTLGINGTTSGSSQIELSNSSSLSFGGFDQFAIADNFFAGTTEIQNLTINRTNGVVLGNQPLTINGTTFLTDGVLVLNGHTLTVTNSLAEAIVRTNGYVLSENTSFNSKLSWVIGTSNEQHIFPFGSTSGIYIPLVFSLNSGDAGVVSVATYGTGFDNLPLPLGVTGLYDISGINNAANAVDRFFLIDLAGESDPNVDVTFSATPGEIGIIETLTAQRWGTYWEFPLPDQTEGPNSVTVSGISQFSPWVITGNNTPLPVELISFTVAQISDLAVLKWETASESDNDYFEIQKSMNGKEFSILGTVEGSGNSNKKVSYSFTDKDLSSGLTYYRLKQMDFDGTMTLSNVILLNAVVNSEGFKIYPNPTKDIINIFSMAEWNNEISLKVSDLFGREVLNKKYPYKKKAENLHLDLYNLSSGTYLLKIQSGTEAFSFRVLKQ